MAFEYVKTKEKAFQYISKFRKYLGIEYPILLAQFGTTNKQKAQEKKVWEDHGVFVGRSLDTYISKLRKKLATDTSVKLINIHGVGYKLEVKV